MTLFLAACFAATACWLAVPKCARTGVRRSDPRQLQVHKRLMLWARHKAPTHRRQVRDRQVSRVIALALALSSELRAGQPPLVAWTRLWPHSSLAVPVTNRSQLDGGSQQHVPKQLRAAAESPGGAGLALIAACWEVGESSGAGLAVALERVAASLHAEREVAAEIEAQLSGARATSRLLVVLPILALILGEALGAEPLRILLTTPYGWGCLVTGLLLSTFGSRWIEQQVRSVSPWPDQ